MNTFYVNGEVHELDAPLTIAGLLTRLAYSSGRVAVAVNNEFVPRSSYDSVQVCAGDAVDILMAVQGG